MLIVPEKSQRRPTTGSIVSIGEKVSVYKKGEKVVYGNFSGHVMDLDASGEKVILRILHDTEILCRVEGNLSYRIGE